MGNLIEFRCGLIDFQVGRNHGKLNFDPAIYIEQCAKSKMKRVMFTCKDAYGDAYYESNLVEQNTMAGNDYLGAAVSKAHELNLELYAYYNVFLDDIYADAHPEHRMIDKAGNPVISYDYYKSLCPNSPYAAVVRERITELIFNYDVDGLFLDITYFRGGTCFCKYCKSEFMKMYGYELRNDISPGTPEYMDFNEFRRATRAMILTTIADTVKEIKNIP
ncbi:MAG: alpha-L-fucosidase, partial [Clostridia bacterium]|nr:alpha-L-fucosidase [Clostridia bacterium]